MNINKAIGTLVSVMGMAVVLAAPSMAQQQTFASASGSGSPAPQSTVFTYTGGSGGHFTTTAGSIFLASSFPFSDPGATLTFTGFTASASVTGTGTASDPYKQALGSGSFLLKSSTNVDLLSGSFGGGNILSAAMSSSTSSITNTVNNVLYDSIGTYFNASGLLNPGSFSISMTSVNPAPSVTGGYLDGFSAGGTSTFSAKTAPATVPEPASVIPFALGGLGLLGLIVRKTRRTSGAAA